MDAATTSTDVTTGIPPQDAQLEDPLSTHCDENGMPTGIDLLMQQMVNWLDKLLHYRVP